MTELVVLRAPMRSRDDAVDAAATVARALDLGLVGTGAVADERARRRLERFGRLPDGSWAWTRSHVGLHLGRVDGPLRHDDSSEAALLDLVHVRTCRWLPDPVDPALVPKQVAYAFSRGGRTLQAVGTAGAVAATERTWSLLQ